MESVSAPDVRKKGIFSSSSMSSAKDRLASGGQTADQRSIRQLQIASWIVLAIVGAIQAWSERHRLFSDGLSYLDIASYYARGDFRSALNSYWSPLYSWLIAGLMLVLHPNPYWHVGLLHLVNYLSYLAAIVTLEMFLRDLVRLQQRRLGSQGLSESTIRIVAYSVYMVAILLLVNLGYNSPDILAMAIQFYLLDVLLKVESGEARYSTYLWFGVCLALGYYCRAAFAPFVTLYLVLAAALLWRRRAPVWSTIAPAALVCVVLTAPFITAISVSKGRFTIGDAGKLNYGWELDGAPRWIHWQGQPGDIGKPVHPTRKVLDSPPTYTFASPVPGTYAPWYDPSYWYEGIKPHLKLSSQIKVFVASLKGVLYLFLRSPVTLPVLVLAFFMGWHRWLSGKGILGYWFLLIPTITYILAYMLVYVDPRYIASSLVVIWLAMLASVGMPDPDFRHKADRVIQELSILFAVAFIASRLESPARMAIRDLTHLHETDWSVNWMLKDGMVKLGLKPTDKVAWIGQAIDAEWARLAGVKIVAEVPVIYERDNTLFRRVDYGIRKQLKEFWDATPEQKAQVFQAFRDAGATVVVTEKLPANADMSEWTRVIPPDAPHLTDGVGQSTFYRKLLFRRIAPAPTAN